MGDLVQQGALAVNDGYRMRNEELGPQGIPFVRGGDIGDGWINTTTRDHIRPELAHRVVAKIARPGDVAFITKGSVGRAGRLRAGQPEVVFAPQVAYWRVVDTDVLDPGFVFYLVRSRDFQTALDGVKTHGAMVADYVSISQQRDFRFRIPDIGSQRAIARVLGTLDDKIELSRRMAQTLHETAWVIFAFHYLHGSGREHWPLEPLREHVEAVRGLGYTGAGLANDGVPLHNLNSIYEGGGYKSLGIKYYLGEYQRRHLVEPGDVVVASIEQGFDELLIAFPARVPRRFGKSGLFSQDLFRLRPRPKSPLSRTFIYLILLRGRLHEEAAGYANGTTINRIPLEALQKPRFAVPPRELVEDVDALVTPLFDRAEAAEAESETLAALRDALLPKLLSGEIRISDEQGVSRA